MCFLGALQLFFLLTFVRDLFPPLPYSLSCNRCRGTSPALVWQDFIRENPMDVGEGAFLKHGFMFFLPADPSTLPTSSSIALFLGLRFCRSWVALNQTLPPHMSSWSWGLFRSSCPCCIGLKPRQSCLRPSLTWVFYLLNKGCVLCKPCVSPVLTKWYRLRMLVIILCCLLNLNIPISPKHFYNLISFVSGHFLCYSQEILS